MGKKSTIAIVVVVVILFVAVGVMYETGIFGKLVSTSSPSKASPEAMAPNVVSPSVVSSSLGGKWSMLTGASGSSLNASSFVSGQATTLPFVSMAIHSKDLLAGKQIPSPFSILNYNNITYNTYQIGIYVPPHNGFAVVTFGHAVNGTSPGFIVSTLNAELKQANSSLSSSNSENFSYKSGTVSGSNYVFASLHYSISSGNNYWHLEGLIANYSSYNILIIYFTPSFTGYTAFQKILTNQVNDIKSASSVSVSPILVSASQVNTITGLHYRTQSQVTVNLNDTSKLLSQYINMTGTTGISKTNLTLLNNTIGKVTTVYAKEMLVKKNLTELAMVKFSSSDAPAALYDLFTKNNTGSSNLVTSTYDSWHFVFQNTTNYNYNYVYNSSTGNEVQTKTPVSNSSVLIGVSGDYMLIFASTETHSTFTKSMAEQILTDENTMI